MIILDENNLADQFQLLMNWRIPLRQIGVTVGQKGMRDDEVITLLMSLRQPTFFTLDRHFYQNKLCHTRYCLALLDVRQSEAAIFTRRLLHHPEMNTWARRSGAVVRVSHAGISVLRVRAIKEEFTSWP